MLVIGGAGKGGVTRVEGMAPRVAWTVGANIEAV